MLLQVAICSLVVVLASGNNYKCYNGDGKDYVGPVQRTVSGKTCDGWASARYYRATGEKRKSKYVDPDNFPDNPFDHNRCRNPLGVDSKPWCYVAASKNGWEYCGVPCCSGQTCGKANSGSSGPNTVPCARPRRCTADQYCTVAGPAGTCKARKGKWSWCPAGQNRHCKPGLLCNWRSVCSTSAVW